MLLALLTALPLYTVMHGLARAGAIIEEKFKTREPGNCLRLFEKF